MIRFLNFFFIPVVQEYLNEISPTIYGPNKPKTSGKALRIPDLQPSASYHYKPATLYIQGTNHHGTMVASPQGQINGFHGRLFITLNVNSKHYIRDQCS